MFCIGNGSTLEVYAGRCKVITLRFSLYTASSGTRSSLDLVQQGLEMALYRGYPVAGYRRTLGAFVPRTCSHKQRNKYSHHRRFTPLHDLQVPSE